MGLSHLAQWAVGLYQLPSHYPEAHFVFSAKVTCSLYVALLVHMNT